MLAADSSAGGMNNTESLYVAVTRAREEATIYGDHREVLLDQFSQGEGKTSTVEYLELGDQVNDLLHDWAKESDQVKVPEIQLPDIGTADWSLEQSGPELEGPGLELGI